jgi:hypothetical protein
MELYFIIDIGSAITDARGVLGDILNMLGRQRRASRTLPIGIDPVNVHLIPQENSILTSGHWELS